MPDLFSKFNSGELIALVAMVGGLLCAVLGIVFAFCQHWQQHRQVEIMAALKQDMLNRGMTADEIWTVLEAGVPQSHKKLESHHSRLC